jgi:phosphotransferase system enzyme I (PtsI)
MAASYGNISIMYPMIVSVKELEKIKEVMDEVKSELESEGVPFKIPEQGIMIETPAAVMMSDELAKMVDFFSIGTNDLTQFVLAADRKNQKLEDVYDSHHPAIMKMIEMVAKSAHEAGISIGICGELASVVSYTEKFLELGIDELTVFPSNILKLRKVIRICNGCC